MSGALKPDNRIFSSCSGATRCGHAGREVARVEEMIGELSRLESETDVLAERARRRLFRMEESLGVGTVFWYQMINWVADLADYAERVGNRLRLLIAS